MNKRTTIIIAFAIVGVAILAGYGLILRGIVLERQQQAALQDQIAPLATALADRSAGRQILETRQRELATAQAELAEAKLAFPGEVDNIEVLDYIVTTAADHQVSLSQVRAREPLTATIGTGDYRVFAYDVEVRGTLGATSSFLESLESGDIQTLMLDQIRVETSKTLTGTYRASTVVEVYVRP